MLCVSVSEGKGNGLMHRVPFINSLSAVPTLPFTWQPGRLRHGKDCG